MDEPTITKEERQEWARLCEAATQGPWTVLENGGGLSWSIREPESGYRDGLEHEADARLIAAARSALPRLLTALAAAEKRAERAEGERGGMYEALGRLVALYESEYDNEPPPARPAWLQDALGGEARKVAEARDAAHYDAVTREMTRREAAESALAALRAEAEGLRARLARATEFAVVMPTARMAGSDAIMVAACPQRDDSILWAVRRVGGVLNRDGEWEYEPMPSSRDEEFLVRCRFPTLDAAWAAAAEAAAKKEGA